MSDTARLSVVIEAQNRSGPGLEAFRREVEGAGVSLERLTLRANSAARATGAVTVTGGAAGIDAFRSGIERATGGTVTLTQQFQRLPQHISLATGEMGKLTQGIGHGLGLFSSFGAGIGTAVVTAAIVGGIAKTATAFGEFDRQIRGTNALLDLTGDAAERSFGRMQQDARAAGVTLGIGATNAVKGLYDTISAGIPVGREAFTVLTVSSKAAVGGLTDTATAADGLTSVLNAYRLSTGQAEKVSDQMFQTVNIGKITFAQLSQGIGTVVPLAAAMGVNFAEVGGSIASATQQGLRSGQAIEGLRAALQAFLKPSDDAAKVAASLGVGFDAATIRSKGFTGALADVVRATGGSEALLGRLFGDVQAINFAFAVTGQNADATARAIASVGSASGTTGRAAEEVNKSLGRSFEQMQARFEELSIRLGGLVSGPLKAIIDDTIRIGQVLGAWPASAGPDTEQVQRVREFAAAEKAAADARATQNPQAQARRNDQLAQATTVTTSIGAGAATGLLVGGPIGAAVGALTGVAAFRLQEDIAAGKSRTQQLKEQAETQRYLNAVNEAGSIKLLDLNRARDAGALGADTHAEAVKKETQALALYNRLQNEGQTITLEAARSQVAAASATNQQSEALKREREETERLINTTAEAARKRIASQAETAPGRAEQEAIRQLREKTGNVERSAQRDAEAGQRVLEERARSLQETAERGRDALQSLRDSAADARGELEALARVRVQGTAEQENRVFALGTRAAQDQLVIEQARLARLQARTAGQPRPPVDRAALRAAARDQALAEQEAKVAELQGRTTIATAQRAVDQALQPPQELPADDLLRRAQAARAAVTRVEGESEEAFQRRTREAEARVRSQEREAQLSQRAAQEQARRDTLRLQGLRDANQELLDQAENLARAAELDRQRAEYEKQYQAILNAREAQAKAGASLEEINKTNPLPPPPSQGAAPAIAALAGEKGITLTIPLEFSTAAAAQNDAAKLQALAAEYQAKAAPTQTDAAATQAAAAQAQQEAAAVQRAAADAITMAAVLFGTPPKAIESPTQPPLAQGGTPLGPPAGPPTAVFPLGGVGPPTVFPIPTVNTSAIAGTGAPQQIAITIAPGAVDVDVHTTGEVDGAALGQQIAQQVFTEIRTQFDNTPESESAGARYGRSG